MWFVLQETKDEKYLPHRKWLISGNNKVTPGLGCFLLFFDKVISCINIWVEKKSMYTKGIPKCRKLQNKMVFYKLHQSSTQTGTPRMHQKEIRDKRLLLNFRKSISIPSKALLLGCWYEENILREIIVIWLTKKKTQ